MLYDEMHVATEAQFDNSDHGGPASTPHKAQNEGRSFCLPQSIWTVMFACYAVFFAGLMIATGRDGATIFVIAISASYALMYFGTASALNALSPQDHVPEGQAIATYTGLLDYKASFAQILTVPILLAFFAIAIAVIRASVM